jgi:hypothetical protein
MFILLVDGARTELEALTEPIRYAEMLGILSAVFAIVRWRASARADADAPVVQFEESQTPVLTGLGLFRDGVLPVQRSPEA